MKLKGRTALITGASRGIGRAIAISLAKNGADIILNYAGNHTKAKEVARIVEEMGNKCILAQADLRKADCAKKIADICADVDILVLNASIQYRNAWSEITVEEFDDQINCNLRSTMLLIKEFAPYMQKKGWGRIITIGSVQEKKPHPDMLVYSSSKAGMTMMAQSLAGILGKDGITVNSVAPGVILTDRNTDALSDLEYLKKVEANIPIGVCGETKDCIGVIKLLCSDEGRYITGQNIFIDGGMSLNYK